MSIIISSLSFSYPEQSARLFESLSLTIHPGWTAFAGANGSCTIQLYSPTKLDKRF